MFDIKNLLNNVYFVIIIVACKLKSNLCNGETCTVRYCLKPPHTGMFREYGGEKVVPILMTAA